MKANTAEEIILGIDFPLLKEQKKSLLKLMEDIDNVPLLEHLEGIVVLINEIQDSAVDTYGKDENEVFDLHDDIDKFDKENDTPESYFKIVHSGYQKGIEREEIQVHGGANANIFLIKTDEGFVIDVYGQNDLIDTMAIFEDTLNENDPLEGIEETGAPENFSDVEVKEFKEKWGQMHNEVCRELGYPLPHTASDDLLMVDFFWIEKDRKWYNKCASLFTPREQAIADYLRLE
jgi:hypothetical protein